MILTPNCMTISKKLAMLLFRRSTIFCMIGLIGLTLLGLIRCQPLHNSTPTPVPGVALPFEVIAENVVGYNPQVVVFYQEEFKAYVANSSEDIPQLLTMLPGAMKGRSLDTFFWKDFFILVLFRRPGGTTCDLFDTRKVKQYQGKVFVILDAMEHGYLCKEMETYRYQILKVRRIPPELKPLTEDITIVPHYYEQPTPTPHPSYNP